MSLSVMKFLLFLGLVQLALVGGNVLKDVENIESELKEDKGSENLKDTEGIREYFDHYYTETCHSFLSGKYDDYFTPNAVFNIKGEKFQGQLELQQVYEDLECQIRSHTVWDIERLGDHAIASMKFSAESESNVPMSGVVIHELVKDGGMWKTDIVFDFAHVNFSRDGNDLNEEEKTISEALKVFFDLACDAEASEYESELNENVVINIGGRRFSRGMTGVREALRLRVISPDRCDIDDFKIVDVEVGADAAIGMVAGHGDVEKKGHPFLEAFEFRKDSEDKWSMDTVLIFLHVSGL